MNESHCALDRHDAPGRQDRSSHRRQIDQRRPFSRAARMIAGCAVMTLFGCSPPAPIVAEVIPYVGDTNNNGFPELRSPIGVTIDQLGSINLRIINTVAKPDLAILVQNQGLDPAVLNLIDVFASVTLDLAYADGVSDTLTVTEGIEPFERLLEIACPEQVNIRLEVDVFAPVLGTERLFDYQSLVREGVDFDCGQTIDIETFLDDQGVPAFRIDSR